MLIQGWTGSDMRHMGFSAEGAFSCECLNIEFRVQGIPVVSIAVPFWLNQIYIVRIL